MLEVKDLKKNFGNNKVLKGIDFKIEKGEFVFLVGSSGSRKINTYKTYIKRRRANFRKYNY